MASGPCQWQYVEAMKAAKNHKHTSMTNGTYDPTDLYGSDAYDFNALYAPVYCCNP